MITGLSGVQADQKRSYLSLEKYARLIHEHLKLAPPRRFRRILCLVPEEFPAL